MAFVYSPSKNALYGKWTAVLSSASCCQQFICGVANVQGKWDRKLWHPHHSDLRLPMILSFLVILFCFVFLLFEGWVLSGYWIPFFQAEFFPLPNFIFFVRSIKVPTPLYPLAARLCEPLTIGITDSQCCKFRKKNISLLCSVVIKATVVVRDAFFIADLPCSLYFRVIFPWPVDFFHVERIWRRRKHIQVSEVTITVNAIRTQMSVQNASFWYWIFQ